MSSSPKGSSTKNSSANAATGRSSRTGRPSSPSRSTAPRKSKSCPACRPRKSAARHGCSPRAATARSITASASPSTARARPRSWRSPTSPWLTGNIGRPGVGVNPLRGQNNVQGACDMGSFPHELPGYRHMSDDATRDIYESLWGVKLDPRAGPAHPQHAGRRRRRLVQGHLHPGRGHPAVRSRTPSMSRPASRRWNASSCTTSSSTRPPTTPMSSCRARPSSRRTGPSPMPSAASTACAR